MSLIENLNKYATTSWFLYKFLPAILALIVCLLFFWNTFVGLGYFVSVWQGLDINYQIIILSLLVITGVIVSYLVDISFYFTLSIVLGFGTFSLIWSLPGFKRYYKYNLESAKKEYEPYKDFQVIKAGDSVDEAVKRYLPPSSYYQLFPVNIEDTKFRPSRAANLLMAIEEAVNQRYGLDVAVTWDLLLLQIDVKSQEYVADVRSLIDLDARLQLYSILCFGTLVGLFIYQSNYLSSIICFVAAIFAKFILDQWLLGHLILYGKTVLMIYVAYRFKLYEQLHISLPEQSDQEEVDMGKALSQFIDKGTGNFTYRHPPVSKTD